MEAGSKQNITSLTSNWRVGWRSSFANANSKLASKLESASVSSSWIWSSSPSSFIFSSGSFWSSSSSSSSRLVLACKVWNLVVCYTERCMRYAKHWVQHFTVDLTSLARLACRIMATLEEGLAVRSPVMRLVMKAFLAAETMPHVGSAHHKTIPSSFEFREKQSDSKLASTHGSRDGNAVCSGLRAHTLRHRSTWPWTSSQDLVCLSSGC